MDELNKSPAWRALEEHFEAIRDTRVRDLFSADQGRFDRFSLHFNDILLDFSKNHITDETLRRLLALAEQEDISCWARRMVEGECINFTEGRPALHTALRSFSTTPLVIDGEDVRPKIRNERERMRRFSEQVRSGVWRGHSGKRVTDVVNIGIGGSDLGPLMVTEALRPYGSDALRVHFVSNVDGSHVAEVIKRLDHETCLFIVSSKSFTTQETLTNAATARRWLIERYRDETAALDQFVAVSADVERALAFGIPRERVFEFWDWVGGRYSLWSAVGLPIMLYLGYERYEELLRGAEAMDQHFLSAPLAENMPVIMALLGIWYASFHGADSQAILPYDQYLHRFTAYMQQTDMESNGKRVDRDGKLVAYHTGPVVWGESGTNGQHAFYQHLHQGTGLVPIDFIAPIETFNPVGDHHLILLANFFSQSEALMLGRTEQEAREEMQQQGLDEAQIASLLPHRTFPGNKPSNSILVRRIDPYTLGSLIALYEHKVFAQGILWRINSFDQMGVELGKQLARTILAQMYDDEAVDDHDSSTNGLINYYKSLREPC